MPKTKKKIIPKRKIKIPPVVDLDFKAGDLIVKQGDYGISIYEIIKGRVGIYVKSGVEEINLANLGPGEIIGEMTFLTGITAPRTASARALEDSRLQAWHPAVLSKEYAKMPPILKLIVGQSLKRLKTLNTKISELSRSGKKIKARGKRSHYRKELDLRCSYRPIRAAPKVQLLGQIQNLSKTGAGMIVNSTNTIDYAHNPGNQFALTIYLAADRQVDINGEIVSVNKAPDSTNLFLGISFFRISEEAQKQLGFFLMP
jgi:CRP-like cAMP-binding protein